ncbi:MAG: isoprenylcysteine carboxylmethyltransferase family protein [Candidatus Buchananbacteria bacterium]
MEKEKTDALIKRYQLEHLVPFGLTAISIYFWCNYFQQSKFYFFGLFINFVGLIIWWSAKLTLAENWSAGYGKPQVKKLVTSGIYSKISHPLYWGINLCLIGLVLIYPKVWFATIDLLIVVYFFVRMKIEDKYLTKAVGKEYQDYKRKTWI